MQDSKIELLCKIINDDSIIQILYQRDIIHNIENDILEGILGEYNIKDLYLEDIYFIILDELETPSDIKEYTKLLNKIKKSDVEKEAPDYIFSFNEELQFMSDFEFNSFYNLDYIIDNLQHTRLYELKYLNEKEVKRLLKN